MSELNIDYDAIGNAAAEAEDQTQMKEGGGGFDRPVPAEGRCTLRLQQYIELGKQKSNNPKYKDSEQVMLRFEVNSPKHMIELPDGTKVPNTITVRLPKGGKTSKYGRLFIALNYSGKHKHFAQMVGKAGWLADITHNIVNPGTKEEKTYANLDKNKAWTFGAPVFENPATGETVAVPVPELDGSPQVFLYENAGLGDTDYKALWDTLFIEGEQEAGPNAGKSKNWIQDSISASIGFSTSRLAQLIEGNSAESLEDIPVEAKEEKPKKAPKKAVKEPEVAPEPDVPVQEEKAPEPVPEDDIDPLVAAGLA